MPLPAYVTPTDLLNLFPERELVEVSNLRDAAAEEVNVPRLQAACDGANGIAYGYLGERFTSEALQVSALPDGYAAAFKIHCANLARDILDGSIEEVRAKANEARLFFQGYIGPAGTTGSDSTVGVEGAEPFGTVTFAPGRQRWDEDRLQRLFGTIY